MSRYVPDSFVSEADNQSLKITLSSEQLEKLNKAAPFNPGFPAAFFGSDPHFQPEGKPDSALVNVVSRPWDVSIMLMYRLVT
jgi:hypothetical protein